MTHPKQLQTPKMVSRKCWDQRENQIRSVIRENRCATSWEESDKYVKSREEKRSEGSSRGMKPIV